MFTNAGLFTSGKLRDTQTLPTRSWFIALSPLIRQKSLTQGLLTRIALMASEVAVTKRVSLITGLLITGLDWTGLESYNLFYALWYAICHEQLSLKINSVF